MAGKVPRADAKTLASIPMRILVVGGCGERGMRFIRTLDRKRTQLSVLDNLSGGIGHFMEVAMYKGIKFYHADVANLYSVIQAIDRVSQVYNFSLHKSEDSRGEFETNYLGSFNLIEAIANTDKPPKLFTNSDDPLLKDFISKNATKFGIAPEFI